MAKSVHMGIFVGAGDKLNPEDPISRQEAFIVLARAFSLTTENTNSLSMFVDESNIASWAKEEISALVANDFLSSVNGYLYPEADMLRKDFAVIVDKLAKQYIKTANTYTEVENGSIVVSVPDVILKDLKVSGNLIIGDGVGDGDITLDNVNVTGSVIVRGGGVNSVIITGKSVIDDVIIAKASGNVRVVTSEEATVKDVVVSGGNSGDNKDIILEGAYESVAVKSQTPVAFGAATIKTVIVDAPNAAVTFEKGTVVTSVGVKAPDAKVTLNSGAEVVAVVATEDADRVDVTVTKGAELTQMVSSAPKTIVQNNGDVGSVSLTKEATGSTYAVGDDAKKGTSIVTEHKADLNITTQDAHNAEVAAKEAKEAAEVAQAAADAAALSAKTAAEKAAAQKLAEEASEKAAKQKETEDKAKEENDKVSDKVEDVKDEVTQGTVEPPKVSDDGVVDVPDAPKPSTPDGGSGGGSGGADTPTGDVPKITDTTIVYDLNAIVPVVINVNLGTGSNSAKNITSVKAGAIPLSYTFADNKITITATEMDKATTSTITVTFSNGKTATAPLTVKYTEVTDVAELNTALASKATVIEIDRAITITDADAVTITDKTVTVKADGSITIEFGGALANNGEC